MRLAHCLSMLLLLGVTLAACGDDHDDDAANVAVDESREHASTETPGEKDAGSQDDAARPAKGEPLYAVASMIFGDQGQSSYLAFVKTFDRSETLKFDDAREFPGYAPADASAGKVFVGSGDGPSLTAFEISDSGEWKEGEQLSFSQYLSMPFPGSLIVSAEKAYVPYDTTNFVRWNPTTFEILGDIGAPEQIPLLRGPNGDLPAKKGYSYQLRKSKLFQPYYYSDDTYHQYDETSFISVIDTDEDKVVDVLEAPCPHLHISSADEDGNIYFSNGQGSIPAAVGDAKQPRNCFVRVPAGADRIDEDSLVHFEDIAGGREGSNFFYVRNGLAIFNVYHAERDAPDGKATFELADRSENYHVWTYDLKTKEAKIMEGLDYAGGQFVAFRLGDQLLLTIPKADYSSTAVYAIDDDGKAEKRFDVDGWAYKMFQVR